MTDNKMISREDRIGRYLKKYLNRYVFLEFSDEFAKNSQTGQLLKGVSIPLKKDEVQSFAGGEGVSMLVIADNMANVMGCDPKFKFTENYVAILKTIFDDTLLDNLVKRGNECADDENLDDACIYFRAVLCMNSEHQDAMYSYARICRSMYEASENEEYVGRFKAESLEWFELLTEAHPQFGMGYYYLGYSYLNLGLYAKAKIAWEKFLEINRRKPKGKEYEEITDRVKQMEDPVNIELGCMKISMGHYEEGLAILEPYADSEYKTWWPLYYYLGVGYVELKEFRKAELAFKRVLSLNGSHLDSMRELVEIYQYHGDWVNVKKFTEKIKMVEASQKIDQEEYIRETQAESKRMEEWNEESDA